MADEESKSILHEFPRSNWSNATGQCVKQCYLSATMVRTVATSDWCIIQTGYNVGWFLVGQFFRLFSFFCFVFAIFDLVHDVEAIFHLSFLLKQC